MNRSAQKLPSFDELVKLALEDEAAFEQLKREKCEEMIQSASIDMQPRLWAQQSHIDRVVGQCKNPNHVNVVLMQELVKQVQKFQAALQGGDASLVSARNDNINGDKTNVVSISKRHPDWR
ncbi:DUF3135 domain-containing protein [Vibrio renipiscarius]|uniref:DUF3135 domain-containing protein n=1 Tax=Vibrio renipiscarius TaxID=1461322 RepID=A0A0C2NZU1_9VIBR|nr:DUF3135 domain-containing protein [Vibrio renipiscarius]KII81178.1 hypothetical protein OJ16_02710 [Vibrio renipiscarius]KII81595.1 hypothetical protein PL18_03235 [Vibrio renipiscarius]